MQDKKWRIAFKETTKSLNPHISYFGSLYGISVLSNYATRTNVGEGQLISQFAGKGVDILTLLR